MGRGRRGKRRGDFTDGYHEMPRWTYMECLGGMRLQSFLTLFTHATPGAPASILYINTLSWGPSHASVGYSLQPTRTSSLSMDAVCLSHCYKVLSDPIW